jgi:RsiW-degrading membrane proteinase PrsW (M82 family)
MKREQAKIELHKPQMSELLFFLLSGAIVSVPLTLFVEQYFASPLLVGLSSFDITLITVAIFAPFIEEFSKAFPLFYRHGETQRSIIKLAVFVGLGFGIVEFITYVGTFGPQIIVDRIPGLLFHPASTAITAYGIATNKPFPYYMIAVSLHFANNFLAILAPVIIPSSVIVMAITVYAAWKFYERTKEKFIKTEHVICMSNEENS